MRTLAYTPSVEVYACVVGKGGSKTYLDLTTDVTSCAVSLKQDGASTATIKLMNEGGKYTNVFEPMDMLTIFANKGEERNRVFTGYMTKVSAFTLHPSDFSITAKDSIYRLQELYWDIGVEGSAMLMSNENSLDDTWGGYEGEILKLATNVGGMNPDSVIVDSMPDRAIEAARELYEAQRGDVSELESMSEEFYRVLGSASQAVSGSLSAASGVQSEEPASLGSAEVRASSDQQRRIVSAAYSTPTAGAGRCAAWVYNVYANAGLAYSPTGNANDLVEMYCPYGVKSKLRVGMMIGGKNTGYGAGAIYGHIGVYVGDDTVRHNLSGVVQDWNLDKFIGIFVDQCKWGFPPNVNVSVDTSGRNTGSARREAS
jgi:hypothetical protein